jgi:hypothetical protein
MILTAVVLMWISSETKQRGQFYVNKGNNKITELRAILQRESQNS